MILPGCIYGALLVLAFLVWRQIELTLYCVALLALLLLFVGIRNAWGIAVWMALSKPTERTEPN